MKLKTCTCGREVDSKDAKVIGKQVYELPKKTVKMLFLNCTKCNSTFTLRKIMKEAA